MSEHFIPNLINAAVFSLMGLALFIMGFWTINALSPSDLWHEIIEEHNTALGIMIAGISIGICIIIAASVHGG